MDLYPLLFCTESNSNKILLCICCYAWSNCTLDELFEALTLIQNKIINNFPIVIFDKKYHEELIHHIQMMSENESISPEDMKLIFVTDSVDELIAHIKKHTIKQFVLKKQPYKSKWWFGERRKR
ncbi:LOG family protein [Flavobacterium sp. LT1R49]|uniref:LOG family protein n=1 Tax=Flavobacterium arabinosi TaxID=3398737 RepID=UPI003A87673B